MRTLSAVLLWSFFITKLVQVDGKWTGMYGWRDIDGREDEATKGTP